jgi:peptide/nickel transport system substrate-binding protein
VFNCNYRFFFLRRILQMNKLIRIATISMLVVFIASILPVSAQETGSGGVIIEPNFGDDPKTFNPIIANDGTSSNAISRMYPDFIAVDSDTVQYQGGAKGGLVESWDISEDGLTYTFTLRDDLAWSDGVSITSADVVWFLDAALSGETTSPRQQMIDSIVSYEAPDDYTLVIEFIEESCTSIDILSPIVPVPAHVFEEVFGDDYTNMEENDYNLNPLVTGGETFIFSNFRPGEQTTLIANPDFPDAELGAVIPEGWIFKVVTDQVIQMEQFFSGDLTWVASVPQANRDDVAARGEAGEFQTFETPAGTIRFLSLNVADPANPQDGLDEDGNAIDQGHHPVLGDVRVRQALNYGMNFAEINEGAFFGTSIPVASHVRPTDWSFPAGLDVYPFDAELAMGLLDEAGFTDTDGDGVRECNGCEYAEDGTPLAFSVKTNAGNTSQEALYTIMQDNWNELGFDITVEFLEFNTLIDEFTAQTYDAIGIFWGLSTPASPDEITDIFLPAADVLGSGYNTQSYSNPRLTELIESARTLPGCDLEERKAMYGEAYQILRDESPWIWISTGNVLLAAQANVENWDPKAGGSRWNIDAWMASEQ